MPSFSVPPSGSDVWIFAGSSTGGSAKAMHWDGNQWLDVPLPAGVYPDDAVVLGPSDVWVLGPSGCAGSAASGGCTTTIYHWDGAAWSPFTVPILADELSGAALSGSAPGNVWVGTWVPTKPGQPGRLLHWDGHSWHQITAPRDSVTETPLVTDGHSGVWMGPWTHWTGTRWVSVQAGSSLACGLDDFARVPGTATMWGGGTTLRGSAFNAVICAYPTVP